MKYIIASIPLILAFLLDLIIGDPYSMPHPIRMIGNLISTLEKKIRIKFSGNLRKGGLVLSLIVVTVSTVIPLLLLIIFYKINLLLGAVIEGMMCFFLIAAKCLCQESMKVCHADEKGDIEAARKAVSMIVGRDTECLDKSGIIKAAVETVAENTSDGVTAPIMYIGIGGAPLGFFYKAVNTMDSMIGYKNEKYADIGRFAAKLDDVMNYFPSRMTALIMIFISPILGLNSRNAFRIWRRDRRKHASPNSAQTESACAGALEIRLAGDACYFGELHKKEFIGDESRRIECDDIRRANRLMYAASLVTLLIAIIFRCFLVGGVLL